MSFLCDLQLDFVKALADEVDVCYAIQPNAKLSAAAQIAIYRESMLGKLWKTLTNIYPVCARLVGDDFFRGLACTYINQTPSTSPDLNDYGASLADFIALFPPTKDLPYLSDVARFEWAWHYLLAARTPRAFNYQKLAGCTAEMSKNILFFLPDRSTLLTSPYPLHTIWYSNQTGYANNADIILTDDESYYYLLWRSQLERQIECVSHSDWLILSAIQRGTSLADLSHEPRTAIDLPNFIKKRWIENVNILYPSHGS